MPSKEGTFAAALPFVDRRSVYAVCSLNSYGGEPLARGMAAQTGARLSYLCSRESCSSGLIISELSGSVADEMPIVGRCYRNRSEPMT